jgi:tryptophanyl-tRNA synthetase
MVADQLTTADPVTVARNVIEVGLDYLAVGLDPGLSTVFVQSDVPELQAFAAFYLGLAPAADREIGRIADMTAFGADTVLVGTDQVALVESAAVLARRFNQAFGPVLVEPRAMPPRMGRLPGTDGRARMSRSRHNAIYLSDSPDVVRLKIAGMSMAGQSGEAPPFAYLRELYPESIEVATLEMLYGAGQMTDEEIRSIVLEIVQDFLAPIRRRRAAFAKDRGEVVRILRKGSDRARSKAVGTFDRARSAMHLGDRAV